MPLTYHFRTSSSPAALQADDQLIHDADDSIVLSDLIRTGETSRLRRRGAMRIDSTAAAGVASTARQHHRWRSSYQSPPAPLYMDREPSSGYDWAPWTNSLLGREPSSTSSSSSSSRSSHPSDTVMPAHLPMLEISDDEEESDDESESDSDEGSSFDGGDDDGDDGSGDEMVFASSPEESRSRSRSRAVGELELPSDGEDKDDPEDQLIFYSLVCGGGPVDDAVICSRTTPHQQPVYSALASFILPQPTHSSASHTSSSSQQSSGSTSSSFYSNTNGCGALVHTRALPKHRSHHHHRHRHFSQPPPQPVWAAESGTPAASIVVPLDKIYLEEVCEQEGYSLSMIRQEVCGCVRVGVGCSNCGNPLGFRLTPCAALRHRIRIRSSQSQPSSSPDNHNNNNRYPHRSPSTSTLTGITSTRKPTAGIYEERHHHRLQRQQPTTDYVYTFFPGSTSSPQLSSCSTTTFPTPPTSSTRSRSRRHQRQHHHRQNRWNPPSFTRNNSNNPNTLRRRPLPRSFRPLTSTNDDDDDNSYSSLFLPSRFPTPPPVPPVIPPVPVIRVVTETETHTEAETARRSNLNLSDYSDSDESGSERGGEVGSGDIGFRTPLSRSQRSSRVLSNGSGAEDTEVVFTASPESGVLPLDSVSADERDQLDDGNEEDENTELERARASWANVVRGVEASAASLRARLPQPVRRGALGFDAEVELGLLPPPFPSFTTPGEEAAPSRVPWRRNSEGSRNSGPLHGTVPSILLEEASASLARVRERQSSRRVASSINDNNDDTNNNDYDDDDESEEEEADPSTPRASTIATTPNTTWGTITPTITTTPSSPATSTFPITVTSTTASAPIPPSEPSPEVDAEPELTTPSPLSFWARPLSDRSSDAWTWSNELAALDAERRELTRLLRVDAANMGLLDRDRERDAEPVSEGPGVGFLPPGFVEEEQAGGAGDRTREQGTVLRESRIWNDSLYCEEDDDEGGGGGRGGRGRVMFDPDGEFLEGLEGEWGEDMARRLGMFEYIGGISPSPVGPRW